MNYSSSRDGFVHISEIAHERIESVSGVLSEGQKVKVKLIGFERGKGKLTIKNADTEGVPQKSGSKKGKEKKVTKESDSKEKGERREGAKKWKNKKSDSSEGDVKERKYFN